MEAIMGERRHHTGQGDSAVVLPFPTSQRMRAAAERIDHYDPLELAVRLLNLSCDLQVVAAHTPDPDATLQLVRCLDRMAGDVARQGH